MSISNRDRRTIFGLAKELGLDDDARKDVQLSVTGKHSTTEMNAKDAGLMIAHLRQLRGPGRPVPKRAGRVPKNINREPLMAKIEAQLTDMQLSWQYAERIAYQVSGGRGKGVIGKPGVQRLEWCHSRDLQAVVAALHVEQKKRNGEALVERELARLGKDEDWLLERLPNGWDGKWRRKQKRQEAIIDMLSGME